MTPRARAAPAALAAALLVASQLVVLAHQAATRHVVCEEHGEQLHGVKLSADVHDCDDDHLIGIDGTGGDHEDCALARMLRQNAKPPSAVTLTVAIIAAASPGVAYAGITVATDVVLIAPKTSPPASLG